MNDNQPIIAVVAAIIYHDNKIFAAQRKELGVRFNKWEFPGGKIEKQETAIAALYRELEEELNIRVHNPRLFTHIQHDYEVFMLEMDVFFVDLLPNETIVYQAHKTGGWFSQIGRASCRERV